MKRVKDVLAEVQVIAWDNLFHPTLKGVWYNRSSNLLRGNELRYSFSQSHIISLGNKFKKFGPSSSFMRE